MMNLHQEHHFEREICTHLAANGWLYAEGDAALFNRTHSLFMSTVELKSDFTQSVGDAVDQYRFDRHPQPKGGVL